MPYPTEFYKVSARIFHSFATESTVKQRKHCARFWKLKKCFAHIKIDNCLIVLDTRKQIWFRVCVCTWGFCGQGRMSKTIQFIFTNFHCEWKLAYRWLYFNFKVMHMIHVLKHAHQFLFYNRREWYVMARWLKTFSLWKSACTVHQYYTDFYKKGRLLTVFKILIKSISNNAKIHFFFVLLLWVSNHNNEPIGYRLIEEFTFVFPFTFVLSLYFI